MATWTRPERTKRRELLIQWLDPQAQGEEAGWLVGATAKTIAEALSKRLNRTISKRSVLDYIKLARKYPPGHLLKIARGRPKKERITEVPPKRPPGRPRKNPLPEASVAKVTSQPTPPAPESAKRKPLSPQKNNSATGGATGADRKKVKANGEGTISKRNMAHRMSLIWCEAMSLTGLSPSGLYEVLHRTGKWKNLLGGKSGYHYRLGGLKRPLPTRDRSAHRSDTDDEHSLRLHQVTLRTAGGQWCVVLLGYEPRSHYVNARLLMLHPPAESGLSAKRTVGKPISSFHIQWAGHLTQDGDAVAVQLSADTIWDFADETRAKIDLPVDTIWLSSSLGNIDSLTGQLGALQPSWKFAALPQTTPYLSSDAMGVFNPVEWGRKLERWLNSHNEELAQSSLQGYRARIDKVIKAARVKPDGPEILDRASPSPKVRERSQKLSAFQNADKAAAHRSKSLKISPVHIKATCSAATIGATSQVELVTLLPHPRHGVSPDSATAKQTNSPP